MRTFFRNILRSFSIRKVNQGQILATGYTSLLQAKRRAWNKTERESASEEFLSCIFIHNLDNSRYKQLEKDQHNSYLVGKSIYTDTLIDDKKLLGEWKGGGKRLAKKQQHQQQPKDESGAASVE